MTSPERPPFSPWLIVVTGALGSMAVLGNSIGLISLLLPRMMSEFAVDVRGIQWVLTAFMLTQVVVMPSVGWMGAAIGQKRLYLGSLAVFTVCTFLCTLAHSYALLISLRIVQGASAGFFFPMVTPFIFDAFPSGRRGVVLGVSNLLMTVGSLAGSILASYLADLFGWRWGFYYIIALCITALLLGSLVLRERSMPDVGSFDFAGSFSLGVALISLVVLLTEREGRPLMSPFVIGLGGLFLVAAAAFIFIERRAREPLVDLSIYRHVAFAAGNSLGFLIPAATVAISFLLPIYLQRLLGYSIFQSAMLRIPASIASAGVPPLAGWLSDRTDTRILVCGGIIVFSLTLFSFSGLGLESSWSTIAGLLLIMMAGSMFIWTPMANVMFSALPEESVRLGAGLHALMRQLGRSVGGALVSVIFSRSLTWRLTRVVGGISAGSAVYGAHVDRITRNLAAAGHPAPREGAEAFLHETLWRESTVLAFGDCYLLVGICVLFTLVPALFLKRSR